MKFDYKPKMTPNGSLIYRRSLHVALGIIAFICLAVILSYRYGSTSTETRSALAEKVSSQTTEAATTTAATPVTIPSIAAEPTQAAKTLPPEEQAAAQLKTETEEAPEASWQTIKVKKGDTLSKIFNRLGVSTKDLHEIMTTDPSTKHLASLQPGQTLKLRVDQESQVAALSLDIAPGSSLHLQRKEEGFLAELKELPLEKQIAFGRGKIHDSLFRAGKRAGLDYNILSQMVQIFGWNIDFAMDLQPNDTFRVLFEEKCVDGERVETGHILAAEIVNGGKKHLAIRYTDKAGQTGYFSPDGYGMHQSFLRAPLNFTRISSHFGVRNHPVLHRLREHKGVDYSAPRGTPVQATSDGKVIFVGTRGGYGKVVELQHGARYSTLYAHLSKFPKGLKVGHDIKQGQVIGFVGQTGLATGPHLHYEFRVDGIHRNPLTVALPRTHRIPQAVKPHFLAHAKEMMRLLETYENKIRMAAAAQLPQNE